MKEKIDWYQEVLDLEPGSKVFFPLSKLLVQNNELARAIDTLQHGLERHPEYIEARLYLVDLLHQHSDIKTESKLDEHLDVLVPLLERYAGFWQAWGNVKSGDSKLAISFLAALFQNKSLTLSEIFNKGLQAIDGDNKKSDDPSGGAQGGPSYGPEISEKDDDIFSQEANDITAQAPEVQEDPTQTPKMDESTLGDSLDSEPASKEVVAKNTEAAEKSPKPKITISITKPTLVPVKEEILPDEDEDEEGEERFSLRTRSMAEVLAEQGDYAGALEIYEELLNNSTSSQEKEDLQYRISTLSAYVGNAQEKPVVEDEVSKSPGKDRILSVLETLAERLESRVHS